MHLKRLNTYKHTFPALFFFAIVLIDLIQGQWEYFNNNGKLFYLIVIKSLILVFLTVIVIKKERQLIYIILSIGLIAIIGYKKELFTIPQLTYLAKYLSPFIYFFGFKALVKTEKSYNFFIRISEIFIYIGLVSIILGILFNIESFRTYVYRFGYRGLFKRSIDVSYFLMYASVFTYFFKDQLKKPIYLAIMILIASFIAGTKIPLLFLMLFFGYLFFNSKYKKKLFLAASGFTISTIAFLLLFLPDKLKETFNIFHEIYLEHGLLASITSYRSLLLSDAASYYAAHWTWQNYLFGGRIEGQELTEMSIMDLLIFFGILGTIWYLYYYYKTYYKNSPKTYQLIYSLIFICSIFAGQFFFNPTVTIWFATLTLLVQFKSQTTS